MIHDGTVGVGAIRVSKLPRGLSIIVAFAIIRESQTPNSGEFQD